MKTRAEDDEFLDVISTDMYVNCDWVVVRFGTKKSDKMYLA
jgi:hypothetical protein